MVRDDQFLASVLVVQPEPEKSVRRFLLGKGGRLRRCLRPSGHPRAVPFDLHVVPGIERRLVTVESTAFFVYAGKLDTKSCTHTGCPLSFRANVGGEGREFTSVPLHHFVELSRFAEELFTIV